MKAARTCAAARAQDFSATLEMTKQSKTAPRHNAAKAQNFGDCRADFYNCGG